MARVRINKDDGSYLWRLRPELKEALKGIDLSDVPLNALQESSSDTENKHYWWLTANKKIWSFSDIEVGDEQNYTIRNERGNPRRIYSNFLAARQGDVVVGYETTPVKRIVALCEVSRAQDGEKLYFRKVRDLANQIPLAEIKADPVLSQCEFCRNPNGSFFKLTDEEYGRLEELFEEEDETSPLGRESESYSDPQFLSEVFVDAPDLETMKSLLKRKKNLILQGAPGTGKTFAAKRLAYAMMGCKDKTRVQMVQFHQSSTYEDFVYGYRPNGEEGFEPQPGVFTQFCRRAERDQGNDYFFIIDEINRANVSKVFGELLMLIEADHRGEAIDLGIDGQRLSVPKNLYVIGMMNTADRGLALIDYALRRRFAFFEMRPALDNHVFRKMLGDMGSSKLADLVSCVREVNKTIEADPALGRGFCIGHSYFCPAPGATVTDADVRGIARYEIEPLVEEYWFDDPDKVKAVIAKIEGVL